MEHRRVGHVRVAPIDAARRDERERRPVLEQRADLHRRGVGTQQPPVWKIEGVVHRPRRMIGRDVERTEVVEVVLDFWSRGDVEAGTAEQGFDAQARLGHRMQPALLLAPARQGDVDAPGAEAPLDVGTPQFLAARIEGRAHPLLRVIDACAGRGPRGSINVAEGLQLRGERALLAQPAYPRVLERREIAAPGHLSERLPGNDRQVCQDPLRSADAESGLCLLRDRAECRGVVHGDVREHLAVDFDTGLVQAVDDAAVGESVQARRGVDARDPQCAELTLVLPPVAVRVLACLDDGLLGRAIDLAPRVVVALRLAENFLVTTSGRHATLHSCHGSARLLVVGEELLETADIAVVHETRAAGARLAFDLAVLVAEIVATVGRVALEALRRLAKALGRGPVGFQLGHRIPPGCVAPFAGCSRSRCGRTLHGPCGPRERYFFFGANTMTICLPSMSGFCSTTACGARSPETRSRSLRPMSWCTISRPRNLRVTLALSPSVRKRVRLRSLIW